MLAPQIKRRTYTLTEETGEIGLTLAVGKKKSIHTF
jgi:hypothetical protein